MGFGIRVKFSPNAQAKEGGALDVVAGRLSFLTFGEAPSQLQRGGARAAELILHGAFLEKARTVSAPEFKKIVTLSGTIELRDEPPTPVFVLDPEGDFVYEEPEPEKGEPFRELRLEYPETHFDSPPEDGAPLTRLRLPREPEKARFFELGAELRIGGATESGLDDNHRLDVPLGPLPGPIFEWPDELTAGLPAGLTLVLEEDGRKVAIDWSQGQVLGHLPGSNPAIDAWTVNLKKNLVFLRDELNIGIVRIFLLCNAFNYGTFSQAQRGRPSKLSLPPTMHPKFKEHLQNMLLAFRDTSTMVIPSIIDFKAIGRKVILKPGVQERTVNGSRIKGVDPVTNGCTDRGDIVRDDAIRKQFFDQIRENLLEASVPFRSHIYAWEIENEPSWNVRRIAGDSVAGGRTVTEDELSRFLDEGVKLVESIKVDGKPAFKSTVGHRFLEDLDDFPTGNRRQFHYYPFNVPLPDFIDPVGIPVRDRTLPRFNDTNAFLGEIGIQDPSVGHGDPWPDLNGADGKDTRSRVVARLQHTREQGYPLVMIWADGVDGRGKQLPLPGPDPVQLSPEAQDGIKDFMRAT